MPDIQFFEHAKFPNPRYQTIAMSIRNEKVNTCNENELINKERELELWITNNLL